MSDELEEQEKTVEDGELADDFSDDMPEDDDIEDQKTVKYLRKMVKFSMKTMTTSPMRKLLQKMKTATMTKTMTKLRLT